jgi:hypothetical protein
MDTVRSDFCGKIGQNRVLTGCGISLTGEESVAQGLERVCENYFLKGTACLAAASIRLYV